MAASILFPQKRGLSTNLGLTVKSDKSDWLRIQNEYSEHAQQIGTGQRSRFLVLTKRIVASVDENEDNPSVVSSFVLCMKAAGRN